MESAKDRIRNEIANLAGRKYDHDGCGGLPIRPDVAHFAADLFPPFVGRGVDDEALGKAGDPDILMNKDGTVELSFVVDQRELLLTIHCGGVIQFIKVFEDGQTSIEGVLRGPWAISALFERIGELNGLLSWVATGISK